jgi:hypothetical protein
MTVLEFAYLVQNQRLARRVLSADPGDKTDWEETNYINFVAQQSLTSITGYYLD